MPPGDDEKEEEESHSVAINETFLHLFIYAWFDFLFLVLFHRFYILFFFFFSSSPFFLWLHFCVYTRLSCCVYIISGFCFFKNENKFFNRQLFLQKVRVCFAENKWYRLHALTKLKTNRRTESMISVILDGCIPVQYSNNRFSRWINQRNQTLGWKLNFDLCFCGMMSDGGDKDEKVKKSYLPATKPHNMVNNTNDLVSIW